MTEPTALHAACGSCGTLIDRGAICDCSPPEAARAADLAASLEQAAQHVRDAQAAYIAALHDAAGAVQRAQDALRDPNPADPDSTELFALLGTAAFKLRLTARKTQPGRRSRPGYASMPAAVAHLLPPGGHGAA